MKIEVQSVEELNSTLTPFGCFTSSSSSWFAGFETNMSKWVRKRVHCEWVRENTAMWLFYFLTLPFCRSFVKLTIRKKRFWKITSLAYILSCLTLSLPLASCVRWGGRAEVKWSEVSKWVRRTRGERCEKRKTSRKTTLKILYKIDYDEWEKETGKERFLP